MGWSMPDGEGDIRLRRCGARNPLERVTTSGPVFDLVKLTAINGKHIRMLATRNSYKRLLPYLPEGYRQGKGAPGYPHHQGPLDAPERVHGADRLLLRPAARVRCELCWSPKRATPEQAKALSEDATARNLPEPWTHEAWEAGMRAIADELGMKAGDVFMALRVAVSGRTASPPLFESLEVIGKDETLQRVDDALTKLSCNGLPELKSPTKIGLFDSPD